jgi:hypothetical protein
MSPGPVNSSGVSGVSIGWTLECPYPAGYTSGSHDWDVEVGIYNSAGNEVVGDSAAYGGGTSADTYGADANPNDSAHPLDLVVTMDPKGPATQTFEVVVTLQCNGMDSTVDDQMIKLMRCDPDAYGKAEREFDTANSLTDAGTKDLLETDHEIVQFVDDYVHDTVEIIPEKFDALQVLQEISSHVAEAGEVGGVVVGLSITAEQLELLRENYSGLADGAQADFKQAKLLTARGNADLARALAAKGCLDPIEGQLNKLLKDQKRDDDARALIDTWESNGYLYVSPISHEIVDEATALKQAKAALTGHSSSRAVAQSAAASVKANAEQLRAAIRDMDTALGDSKSVRRDVGRLESATKTLLKRLKALPAS